MRWSRGGRVGLVLVVAGFALVTASGAAGQTVKPEAPSITKPADYRLSIKASPAHDVAALLTPGTSSLRVVDANGKNAGVLTLRPGPVSASDQLRAVQGDKYVLQREQWGQIEWIVQHFLDRAQYPDKVPGFTGMGPEAARRAYQLAVWRVVEPDLDLTAQRASPRKDIVRLSDQILLESAEKTANLPSPISGGSLSLLKQDEYLTGQRFRVHLTEESGRSVDRQLVTLYVNDEPVRVLQSDANGNASVDLPYDGFTGAVQATWTRVVARGTVLGDPANPDQLLLLTSGLSLTTGSAEVDFKDPGVLKRNLGGALQRGLDKVLPFSLQPVAVLLILVVSALVSAVGLVKWLFDALAKRVADRASHPVRLLLWSVAVLICLGLAGVWWVGRNEAQSFSAAWTQPDPTPTSTGAVIPTRASASSTFFNGTDAAAYAPSCAVSPDKQRGRPWISGRGAGVPQILRVDFPQAVVVTAVRVVPGWADGDDADFDRVSHPTRILLVADDGTAQVLSFSDDLTREEARETPEVTLNRPAATTGLSLIVEDVGGAGGVEDNRAVVDQVEVQGAPVLHARMRTVSPVTQGAALECS